MDRINNTKIFNNGEIEILDIDCPTGFKVGQLKHYSKE